MNRTTWIVIIAIVVLGLGGLIAFTKQGSVNVDNLDPTAIIQSENGSMGDHVYGKTDSKVIVFEYADYQCPGCGAAYPATHTIQNLYKDKVAFVFRNFPLTTIHPNALAAASVAEAAGLQGKFWEMHDLLFTQRDNWVNLSVSDRGNTFLSYAKQLGLDTDKFTSDQAGKVVSEKISRDRSLGGKVGVDSTPSFFVGSDKMDSDTVDDVINGKGEKLMDKIDAALKAVNETPPTR